MQTKLITLFGTLLTLSSATFVLAHDHGNDGYTATEKPPKAAPAITMGNGENNWIQTDGITRSGNTLTVPKVEIEKDGWLVVHPFKDGKPNGMIYVGASFLEAGENTDVDLKVYRELDTGTPLVIMLHYDENENGAFDFLFVDERSVLDKAVFEGTTMVSHVIQAP